MRWRLVTRSARLAFAAVAALALTGAATAAATADGRSTAAPACVTDDLTFTVTEETQAGGYLFLTAKAKPGISCTLEGVFPSASLGSSPDTAVSPAEHAVSESVTLEGSTTAYAGIYPKITNDGLGWEFDQLHLSVAGDEVNSITLDLPKTVLVDQPIATNWHADPADAVPFSS
ncbi:DUF4232 domain-containing protein [Streptomyces sp. NPDC093510]|uniref:DUF4232 domain-containing protein n=1 Tax=Streptomyces sp. NPDC093510 TaxID=3155199 RepID=UPI00342801A6